MAWGLSAAAKKRAIVTLTRQTRQRIPPPDLHYLFAPLKRLDYMAQKRQSSARRGYACDHAPHGGRARQ